MLDQPLADDRRQGPVHQGARGGDGRRPRRPRRAFAEGRADGHARTASRWRPSPRARIRATRSCPTATPTSRNCRPGARRRHVEPAPRGAVARALSRAQDRAAARQRQHAPAQARRRPIRRDHPRRGRIEAPRTRRSASRALLDPDDSLPAPGQGALALECRADRDDVVAALAPLADRGTTLATTRGARLLARAGRQLPHAARRLRRMGGGRAVAARPAREPRRPRRPARRARGRRSATNDGGNGARPGAGRRFPRARRGALRRR